MKSRPARSDNTIGGLFASAGNLITNNGGPGVVVGENPFDVSVGDQITANRIYGNDGQAIDLGDDGVTSNSTALRQGPNDFQNFPIVVTTADGQIQGWLDGSTPDATFRIDVFASALYGPARPGAAQDFLGSLFATTDAHGQVVFPVPFTAPAGLPIVTATATDPEGDTSEVSDLRRATLEVPPGSFRVPAGQALVFSPASGDVIALRTRMPGRSTRHGA